MFSVRLQSSVRRASSTQTPLSSSIAAMRPSAEHVTRLPQQESSLSSTACFTGAAREGTGQQGWGHRL